MPASLFLPRSYVRNIHSVPLYGVAQASAPLAPVDTDDLDEVPRLDILLRGSQYYPGAQAYRVVGHSMSGVVEHGDIVLVNPHDAYHPRRPCLFETPNGYIIKMRGLDGRGRPALLGTDPEHPPIRDRSGFRPRGVLYAIYRGPFQIERL